MSQSYNPNTLSDYSLHISLINVSLKQEGRLIDKIVKNIFGDYKNKLKEADYNPGHLYEPYLYYLVGNYDIGVLAEIDNYSFSQRLFAPNQLEKDEQHINFNHQCISGILHRAPIYRLSELYTKHSYLAILNLKLNNKFIISHDEIFIEDISNYILEKKWNHKDKDVDVILIHPFSWFENSVLLFFSDLSDIGDYIAHIREIKIKNLDKFQEYGNDALFDSNPDISECDVFSESVTYIGINKTKIDNGEITNINVRAVTEWKIKPGHIQNFLNELERNNIIKNPESKLILGKSDLILKENEINDAWINTHKIFFDYIANDNKNSRIGNLLEHVKNTKSRFELNYSIERDRSLEEIAKIPGVPSFRDLVRMKIKLQDINLAQINLELKCLNISKQTRQMCLKVFHAFLEGIEDEILSIYFFDFINYIIGFRKWISSYFNAINKVETYEFNQLKKNLFEIERELNHWVNNFQRAYNLRVLNSYKYEDISELTLDFNSSLQQLLSIYNTFANYFGEKLHGKSTDYIVVLSNQSTVSIYNNIQYNVYDLLFPEFVLFSLTKEVFNNFIIKSERNFKGKFKDFEMEYKNFNSAFRSDIFLRNIQAIQESEVFDVRYFFSDAIRYIVNCNFDSDIFVNWTWAHMIKTSAAYSLSSTISEYTFAGVLFRLIFTLKLFGDKPVDYITCPVPELEAYWCKWFPRFNSEVDELFAYFFPNGEPSVSVDNNFILSLKILIINKITTTYKGYYLDDNNNACENLEIERKLCIYGMYGNNNIFKSIINRYNCLNLEPIPKDLSSFESFEWECFSYLKWTKKCFTNKKSYFNFLNRDWMSGLPITSFESYSQTTTKKSAYYIDRIGGVFFENSEKARNYFKHRNIFLFKLWKYSLKFKREMLKNGVN